MDAREKAERKSDDSHCRHCGNTECGYKGMNRRVIGKCPTYVYLDPSLRPPRYLNPDGTKKKRIRIRTRVHFSAENVEFIETVILPGNRKLMGHFTKGVHYCVDTWLGILEGNIPKVPEREYTKYSYEERDMTLLPATMNAVDEIVAYWRGQKQQINRGDVVNYFIALSRKQHEQTSS